MLLVQRVHAVVQSREGMDPNMSCVHASVRDLTTHVSQYINSNIAHPGIDAEDCVD